jgi:hypothetical protein
LHLAMYFTSQDELPTPPPDMTPPPKKAGFTR